MKPIRRLFLALLSIYVRRTLYIANRLLHYYYNETLPSQMS